MTGRRAALALLLVAGLLAAPAPAAASDPPAATPFCERPLSNALRDTAPNATLESTAARVAVDGTAANWTVEATFRNRSTVDYLAGNRTVARRLAARASAGVPPESVTVAAAGPRTLAFRFRTDGAAARTPGGLTRLDAFHVRESAFRTVSCDRLTVVGPPGSVLAARPDVYGATVRSEGNRVALAGDPLDGAFFVFAPADTPPVLRAPLAGVALALAVAGTVLRNAALFVGVPAAVLAAGFVAVSRLSAAVPPGLARSRARELGLTALGLALVGAGPLVWFLGLWEAALLILLPALVAGGVLAGVAAGAHSARASFLPVAAGAVVAGVVAAAAVSLLPVGVGRAVAAAGLVVPVLSGYPLGVAAAAGRSVRGVVAVAAAGYAVAALAYFYPLTAAGGPLYGLLALLDSLVALALVVAAVPFVLVGVGSARR